MQLQRKVLRRKGESRCSSLWVCRHNVMKYTGVHAYCYPCVINIMFSRINRTKSLFSARLYFCNEYYLMDIFNWSGFSPLIRSLIALDITMGLLIYCLFGKTFSPDSVDELLHWIVSPVGAESRWSSGQAGVQEDLRRLRQEPKWCLFVDQTDAN